MNEPNEAPALQVEGVSTNRGRVQVLWDVGLTVARGETVAIVGPNGAGKTTLIGSITGLIPPFSGSVRIGGVDVTGRPPNRLAHRGVALVPERRGIFAPLTVRENLMLGAYARRSRTPRAELATDLEDVIELFPALRRYLDAIAGSLSGGEQQMLAVGRALMSEPKILLLDEPSLGLAPRIIEEILQKLGELNRQGLSIILVEQKAPLVLKLANRAYLLSVGTIAAEIDPRTIKSHDELVQYYLG